MDREERISKLKTVAANLRDLARDMEIQNNVPMEDRHRDERAVLLMQIDELQDLQREMP